jgi:hypothetical protein
VRAVTRTQATKAYLNPSLTEFQGVNPKTAAGARQGLATYAAVGDENLALSRGSGSIGDRQHGGAGICMTEVMPRSGSADFNRAAAPPHWGDFDPHSDTFFQLIDMTDDAHPPASCLQLLQHRDGHG